jgi:hypothetical protein
MDVVINGSQYNMISLYLLLNESDVGDPSKAWKTPPGTPDEIIDVIHNIVAHCHAAGKDPHSYVVLGKTESGMWAVINPVRDFSIGLLEKENQWMFSWRENPPVEIDDIQLNQIISSWAK